MKRILYLSFYFEPDLCAGSFRNSPLAKELAKQVKDEAEVHVITTLPNRYSSFSTEAKQEEWIDNLHIQRIALPQHKSGFRDQIHAFRKYFETVKQLIKGKHYDLVVASSSRLFTAYLGYRIAQRQKVPLYLDIRDIFTDTLNDVIPNRVVKFFLLPCLRFIERKTFGSAKHINLISEGFRSYFQQYSQPNYSYYTNGIDPEFFSDAIEAKECKSAPVVVTYAGNIGEGQGLHKIIPEAAKLLGSDYLFRVIGDGGAKSQLESAVKAADVHNVQIEKPVKRNQLLEIYASSDYLFMHLNDYKAFEKVLPSKVFELGAYPRPMIAGVNGYARKFIQQYLPDALLVAPANPKELVERILQHEYIRVQRTQFIQQFSRERINAEMARSIKQYL